ncbi:cobalt/nickel transport system permease protein [Desulfomicrobium norvegicum]|uniref:Cobalt/nickel transport system permease protein n=1 Tax=Desulfomicrobium norvegicum (strain DSM 1741 / NCIMB 8310) TaxID=52561 RepID=A0A8G2C116_DESNO|nr:cobalt transporter CbiM [Desulfomicrobium norvegicum]SFL44295.1 cobalt/nickel transport system permease protein [Desulfomicrobium norvegicum]
MHISEGVLSPAILGLGAVLTVGGTALGLRRLDYDRLMTVAILAAAFFVGSLVHIPIGPSSAHLILNGLLGAILGWAAFPAILVALMLQSVLFQYGGFTVLGVNAFNMAFPAVLCFLLLRPLLSRPGRIRTVAAFCCGALSVAGAGLLTALSLAQTDEGFLQAARLLFLAHVPVMIVEGIVTTLAVSFLSRIRPELLHFASNFEGETRA